MCSPTAVSPVAILVFVFVFVFVVFCIFFCLSVRSSSKPRRSPQHDACFALLYLCTTSTFFPRRSVLFFHLLPSLLLVLILEPTPKIAWSSKQKSRYYAQLHTSSFFLGGGIYCSLPAAVYKYTIVIASKKHNIYIYKCLNIYIRNVACFRFE